MISSRVLAVMLALSCVVRSQSLLHKRHHKTRTAQVQLQNSQQDWWFRPCSVRNGTSLSSAYPCRCGYATCESNQVCSKATRSCKTTCKGYSCPFGWLSHENQSAIMGKGRTDQACCQSPCLEAKKGTGFVPVSNILKYGSWKTTELTLRSDGAAFLFDTDAVQGPDPDGSRTMEVGEYSRFEGLWSSNSDGSYSVVFKTKHYKETHTRWNRNVDWTKAFSPPAIVTVVSDGSQAKVSDADHRLGLSFTSLDVSVSRNCAA